MSEDAKSDLVVAGGVLALALLDSLVQRGIVSRGDGLVILAKARADCNRMGHPGAAKLVGDAYAKMSADD